MAFMGGLFKGFNLGFGSVQDFAITLGAIILFCVVAFFVFWTLKRKQSWNMKVEFKMPRHEGRIVNAEWGKGAYNEVAGVVWLKRKGKKKVSMKPFNVRKFLQGGNILTVVQVGAAEYRPVMPDSFQSYYDSQHPDNKVAWLDMIVDTTESKPWKESFERQSKNTFSITSLLDRYGNMIAIGLVIFLWGIQFLILYNRIKGGG